MLVRPEGWTLVPTVDGFTMVVPEGPNAAIIRYVERVRPLRPAAEVLEQRIAANRRFTDTRVVAHRRVDTLEGEYGFWAHVEGKLGDQPAHYTLGLVFGDDFYARTEGFCLDPSLFDEFPQRVCELVQGDRHMLGVRRRRYLYQPNGWKPVARGFITDWLAPAFPHNWGMITVSPAVPNPLGADTLAVVLNPETVSRRLTVSSIEPVKPAHTDGGLSGGLLEVKGALTGQEVALSIAAFVDSQYLYKCELLSRSADAFASHSNDFEKLWTTIEALPASEPTAQGTPIWYD